MTTNVPKPTFGPNGFIAPSEQAILSGVQEDINAAFGGGLDPSLTAPQGQLATSEAAIIGNANDTFVLQSNLVDPAYSYGKWQDAIGRIYFISRNPSQPTVVQATCSGLTGVTIPAGAIAKAGDGNLYTCTQGGVIGAGGTVVLPFACNVPGPITCAAGSLNAIYQAINGWDSVLNLQDGVLGRNTETRSEFEARRVASVALNSRGSLPSVLGAVLNVAGVLDAYVTENVASSPATIGGATLVAKSLYVAAVGGSAQAIANAIWSNKAPGCNYNGNVTLTVLDQSAGYSPPYPSYQVTFEIPPALPILFAVNIANNAQVPANAVTQIQSAIIAAFAGSDGGARARIGSTIYALRYVAPIIALGSWAQIISLQVGSANVPAATFYGTILGATLTIDATVSGTIAIGQTVSDASGRTLPGTIITAGAGLSWTVSVSQNVGAAFTGTGSGTNLTISAVTGTVVIGDRVVGTGVPANTIINSQTSGTPGGVGVYVTSNATTSAAAALKSGPLMTGVTASSSQVVVNINQVPTISASNIAVTLT